MPRTTSVFAILCACDCTERFETWKVIFEFTYCIKKKDLAPRPPKFALFESRDSSMDVPAFIMLLLWSEKEYGLLTSNLLRLGLRGFSNNGLTFSFNCVFTSNILWVENDTWKKIIKVKLVSCFARAECSLRKGTFHSIRESEICFVLRVIKRNYKLKFSGLTVEKVSCPIIEPVSCLMQSIFWNVGRISDFVDWNVQRDAGTLVQERSFFSKTAFSHKVWPIHLKFMNNFDV